MSKLLEFYKIQNNNNFHAEIVTVAHFARVNNLCFFLSNFCNSELQFAWSLEFCITWEEIGKRRISMDAEWACIFQVLNLLHDANFSRFGQSVSIFFLQILGYTL